MDNNQKTIGIVGGGQLGRMMAQAARKLNFRTVVLDPTPNSPAGQVADKQIVGDFKDKDQVINLSKHCDYLTFETESANCEALEQLDEEGFPVNPNPKALRIIKDKFEQKVFLRNNDIPVADFALITSEEDCIMQGEIFGYPYLLKARFDAYDGRGNYLIKSKEDIEPALIKFKDKSLYAEKFVDFRKELAVICAKDKYGKIISYPVVETVHENNICNLVRSPANVGNDTKIKAETLAKQVLEILDVIGVLAVEMFLGKGGELYVNELAPRVHNSGHHTIEAFSASQFDQLIRAVSGMPLAEVIPSANSAVMVNILGERDGDANYKYSEEDKKTKDVNIHIYGKMETRKERKMGHITALGDSSESAEEKALLTRNKITI